ncbi:MAG TPA: type VI secretion system tip protein TssI/VgrG, partial [Polyangiaceae bacterium]|nr:type VI secretion system tip protein TssI/VgrG [Polyangiaceae bacterium]
MVNAVDPGHNAGAAGQGEVVENARVRFPEAPDARLSVREFEVEERISQLFEVRLRCVSPDEDLDLSRLIGARAEFELSGHVERSFRGVCRAARFVRVAEAGQSLATYAITIVPVLWRLTQRVQNRLFQHISIPAIVKSILDEWKIEHEYRIDWARYPPVELRTQYGESDYAFVSRLLEEAGISAWFVDAGSKGSRLVLGDMPHASEERRSGPLRFVDDASLAQRATTPQLVTRVEIEEVSRPGRFTARDYDFMRPRHALFTRADAARSVEHAHEQFVFMPGLALAEDALSPATATPTADDLGVARGRDEVARTRVQRMLEAAQSARRAVFYEASVNDLSPGVVFRIGGHPRPDLSDDHRFLVLQHRVEGKVADPSSWVFEGAAVSTAEPFRPPQITPKPRIYSLQTAVVVGPTGANAEVVLGAMPGAVGALHPAAIGGAEAGAAITDNTIYVDEHGRVRVQFPWDRGHGFDKHSSVWTRVSQGWAGAGYGLFTIPRVGHEVLIAFLDGDPDCPLVVGRVHNAADPAPYPLPANATVSTWKTSSTPSGDGFNELRFDDASGREHVYLQAQKDMDHLVKNHLKQAVGGDSTRYVQTHDAHAVGGSRSDFVNMQEARGVGLNQANFVGLNRTSQVGVEDSTMVGTRWAVTVARGMTSRLVSDLERIAGNVGDTVRSAAHTVLGGVPSSPLAMAADSALANLGEALFEGLKGLVEATLGKVPLEAGPPPTTIEMVDRQIKLSTGEASIVLDGPNITLSAQGNIVLHAMDHVSVLSEKEIAIGARDNAAMVSATGDIILQAKRDLHLNPFAEGGSLPEIERLEPPVPTPADPEVCAHCGGAIAIAEDGGRSCSAMQGELPAGRIEPLGAGPADGADAGGEAFGEEARVLAIEVLRHGLSGDLLEHLVKLAADAMGGMSPSYRRVLAWLKDQRQITSQELDQIRDLSAFGEDPGFVGAVLRWWAHGEGAPASARWTFIGGDL